MTAPAPDGAGYDTVVGLEVHVQLTTHSKIFSGSSPAFGSQPNASIDPVCLGLPGTLPVLNRAAVEAAVRLGLAAGCRINRRSRFARKHYFYPDLPKGFQISQYEEPLCEGGVIPFRVRGDARSVRLVRIHLEEDAGKSLHVSAGAGPAGASHVDYNRAGVPLCEIVSEPDLRSADEAAELMRAIRTLVRALSVCDGNMEEGSLRCDANVSVRSRGVATLGTKTELKNLNSFKNVRDAVAYEARRQAARLDRGLRVAQETRLWDPARGVTAAMRSKEDAHDYRYFPEPDLPPLALDDTWIQAVRAALPELPEARFARYTTVLSLPAEDADVLTADSETAAYFDAALSSAPAASPKRIANWVINEVLPRVDHAGRLASDDVPVPAAALGELVALIDSGALSGKLGKDVFGRMWSDQRSAREVIASGVAVELSDVGAVEQVCRRVVASHPDEAARFRAGEQKLRGFFVGAVMKETGGKANPKVVSEILSRVLA